MTYVKLLILFFSVNSVILSQSGFQLFPPDLLTEPFNANHLEPKLGFLFHTAENEIRLDIGNSMDLAAWKLDENEFVSAGADLFTYTLLRGESNFHFPVDAIDYLFGLNASYRRDFDEKQIGARLRISHISAHFVDGHYDPTNQIWRDNQKPKVYSREFVELMPYFKTGNLRVYAGISFLFHVDPERLGKDSYEFGAEYFAKDLLNEFLTPFISYDFKLVNYEKYRGNNSIIAGLKIGFPDGRGLSLYFNYYAGQSIHGEYFDFVKKYFAFGVNLDI